MGKWTMKNNGNMNGVIFISFSVITFILYSCTTTRKEREINSMISEWSGKEIMFPKDMCFVVYGKDTVEYPKKRLKYSIVCYMDSAGCTSCKLQPQLWKKYISLLYTADGEKVPVLFFMHPRNKHELIDLLENTYFNYPVCIDEDDAFNRLNHFPSDMSFQTFLLDKDNKVIAIGNPVHNLKLGELYLQIIKGVKKQQDNIEQKTKKTKVITDKSAISLGVFDWQTKQIAVFTLKNIGNNPLVIENISTSCGCISVVYSQKPILSAEETKVEVTYKADQPGYFNKKINVYCNADSLPIVLSISGKAK